MRDLEKDLNDEYWHVRLAAVRSEHFGPEHMSIALNDEDWAVRRATVQSKHFNTYCYIRYLDNQIKLTKVYE